MLFDAALEFGANWRRDVAELAAERLPTLDPHRRASLASEVQEARSAIERWVQNRWETAHSDWSQDDTRAAEDYVRATYPWMNERNITHAVSQSMYYAWHG